jgi:DNA-binding LytR/AlgR family response regulator
MNTKPIIELPTQNGSEFINPESIISIKACNKSIYLCSEIHKDKIVHISFGKAEKLLDNPFFVKCHRSYIINILKIKALNSKERKIIFSKDKSVPLSDTYKKNFEQALKKFCKK